MEPTLHVGRLPDHLDHFVVAVPGHVHPRDLKTWLGTLFAVRTAVLGEAGYEIACNNPHVVDLFEPENVIVWSAAGHSARLGRSEAWARAKGILSPGEFWANRGESWVDSERDGG